MLSTSGPEDPSLVAPDPLVASLVEPDPLVASLVAPDPLVASLVAPDPLVASTDSRSLAGAGTLEIDRGEPGTVLVTARDIDPDPDMAKEDPGPFLGPTRVNVKGLAVLAGLIVNGLEVVVGINVTGSAVPTPAGLGRVVELFRTVPLRVKFSFMDLKVLFIIIIRKF